MNVFYDLGNKINTSKMVKIVHLFYNLKKKYHLSVAAALPQASYEEQPMSYDHKFNAWYVYMLCCIAALGGVMFGYSTGVIAAAVGSMQKYFALSSSEMGWAVSSVIVGAVLGSLMAGKIADRIGRKNALLLAALLFVVTSVISAVSSMFWLFSIARIVCGLAVGIAGTVSPMYMSEIAPARIRGKASGIYNVSTNLGQLAVFIVNFFIARGMVEAWMVQDGWRWMMGLQLVPSLLMLLLIAFLPESPHWNIKRQRGHKAINVLSRIYPEFNKEEARQLFEQAPVAKSASAPAGTTSIAGKPVLRYILLVGIMIAVLQQFTGVNVMNYYAPLVLQGASSSKDAALFQTIFIALFSGVGGIIGMNLFDRYGRLPVMKIGTVGSMIGLLIVSYGLYTQDTGYMTIFGILFFMLLFSIGWGSGAWVLISEIFPERIRSFGMSLAVSCLWIANFVITQLFPVVNDNAYLQDNFHGAFSMWLFVGFNALCFWFLHRYVPETKGVSLEDIEQLAEQKMQQLQRSTDALASNK